MQKNDDIHCKGCEKGKAAVIYGPFAQKSRYNWRGWYMILSLVFRGWIPKLNEWLKLFFAISWQKKWKECWSQVYGCFRELKKKWKLNGENINWYFMELRETKPRLMLIYIVEHVVALELTLSCLIYIRNCIRHIANVTRIEKTVQGQISPITVKVRSLEWKIKCFNDLKI